MSGQRNIMTRIIEDVEAVEPELTVPLEKACFIIMRLGNSKA